MKYRHTKGETKRGREREERRKIKQANTLYKIGNVSELSYLDIGTGFGFLKRELTEARQTSLDRIYKKGNEKKKKLRVKKKRRPNTFSAGYSLQKNPFYLQFLPM